MPFYLVDDAAVPRKAGRPKGPPATVVNVRLPLTMIEKLDRYLKRRKAHTGHQGNRSTVARRAMELFLAANDIR